MEAIIGNSNAFICKEDSLITPTESDITSVFSAISVLAESRITANPLISDFN